MTTSRARLLALAGATALVLGSCASASNPSRSAPIGPAPSTAATVAATGDRTTATTPSPATAPGANAVSPLPDVTVLNAGTGETVELASLLPADRPLLVWFWAPH